jgi:hypothetical protein
VETGLITTIIPGEETGGGLHLAWDTLPGMAGLADLIFPLGLVAASIEIPSTTLHSTILFMTLSTGFTIHSLILDTTGTIL